MSSTSITFFGSTSYKNYIGQLNLLASAYENSSYTSGSRYFGYSTQTEFCTEFNSTSCPTDTGYTIDQEYLSASNVLLTATNVKTLEASSYWLASRCAQSIGYSGRIVNTSGSIENDNYLRSGSMLYSKSYALRPIITIKSSAIPTTGDGTKNSPYWMGRKNTTL